MRMMPIDPNLNVIRDGLILWIDPYMQTSYPKSGTTWTDISGFGNNITVVSGSGTSVVYDSATNSFIYNPDAGKVQRTYVSGDEYDLNLTKKMSFEFFVKFDNVTKSNANGLCAFGNMYGDPTVGAIQYEMYLQADAVRTYNLFFRLCNGSSQRYEGTTYGSSGDNQIGKQLVNNTWHHLVFTYDNSNGEINIYVDTIASSINYVGTNLSGTIALPTSTFRQLSIGCRRSGSSNFGSLDGNLASFRIYNKALSQDEITHNFNTQRVRFGI